MTKATTRPRLAVYRSNKKIYAQVIDDALGHTLAAAVGKSGAEVGRLVAKSALSAKISTVVFDRRRYKYHGQVKQLAEAARAAGLKF